MLPSRLFRVLPLILLVMLLPITVNGIGTDRRHSSGSSRSSAGRARRPSPVGAVIALGVVGNLPGGISMRSLQR